MSKILECEKLLKKWEASSQKFLKYGQLKHAHNDARVAYGIKLALSIFKEPSNHVNAPDPNEEQRKADWELDEVHPPELRAFE